MSVYRADRHCFACNPFVVKKLTLLLRVVLPVRGWWFGNFLSTELDQIFGSTREYVTGCIFFQNNPAIINGNLQGIALFEIH